MSTQQADTDMIDAVNYRDQAKLDAVADIDATAANIQSVLQTWQSTIFPAVHEPEVQSTLTPNDSLTIAAQSKLTDINLGGLSTCKVDPKLEAGNWI